MKAMYGVVLLCTEGMAICEDDWEDLWCAEMPEEFVTEGDGIEIDGLTPLEDLPIEKYAEGLVIGFIASFAAMLLLLIVLLIRRRQKKKTGNIAGSERK